MTQRQLSLFVVLSLAAFPVSAQDVLKVGSAVADFTSGSVVPLNLYLSDASGTALGGDRGTGNTIQGISMTVRIDPAAWVSAVAFERAGLTDGLVERFETQRVDGGNRVTWLVAFDEIASPLTPTLDGFDLLGRLDVTLSSQVPESGVIYLTVIPATTGLSNSSGSRFEPGGTGQLELVSGAMISVSIFADGFESGDLSAWPGGNP